MKSCVIGIISLAICSAAYGENFGLTCSDNAMGNFQATVVEWDEEAFGYGDRHVRRIIKGEIEKIRWYGTSGSTRRYKAIAESEKESEYFVDRNGGFIRTRNQLGNYFFDHCQVLNNEQIQLVIQRGKGEIDKSNFEKRMKDLDGQGELNKMPIEVELERLQALSTPTDKNALQLAVRDCFNQIQARTSVPICVDTANLWIGEHSYVSNDPWFNFAEESLSVLAARYMENSSNSAIVGFVWIPKMRGKQSPRYSYECDFVSSNSVVLTTLEENSRMLVLSSEGCLDGSVLQ